MDCLENIQHFNIFRINCATMVWLCNQRGPYYTCMNTLWGYFANRKMSLSELVHCVTYVHYDNVLAHSLCLSEEFFWGINSLNKESNHLKAKICIPMNSGSNSVKTTTSCSKFGLKVILNKFHAMAPSPNLPLTGVSNPCCISCLSPKTAKGPLQAHK